VGKTVHLQLDQNMAFEDTVVEYQINKEIIVADQNAFLP
jgi:hypothetical protein